MSLPQNMIVKGCFGGYLAKSLILQNEMSLMESHGNLGSGLVPNTRSSYIGVFVSLPLHAVLLLLDVSLVV